MSARLGPVALAAALALLLPAARAGAAEPAAGKEAPAVNGPQNEKVVHTDAEWRKLLTPEQYRIARQQGTEAPFTGKHYLNHETGVYHCAACGQELFRSDAKFDSACGWPSFSRPAEAVRLEEKADRSHGMARTEAVCPRCGAHLGHVFNDGPAPTGLRYCINSAVLDFKPAPPAAPPPAARTATAVFAAGCFWGVEAAFRNIPGVTDVKVGYTGGRAPGPSYKDVCTGRTGHAEAAEVTYDPAVVSYDQLLAAFWKMHDPTQVNRQGPDIGSQYRSAIFYGNGEQRRAAEASRTEAARRLGRPVATAIEAAGEFWPAEEYHQRYLEKHGGAACGR